MKEKSFQIHILILLSQVHRKIGLFNKGNLGKTFLELLQGEQRLMAKTYQYEDLLWCPEKSSGLEENLEQANHFHFMLWA